MPRIVVTDIETFLGQNVSERGGFDNPVEFRELEALLKVYHDVWLPKVGTSGIRIVNPDETFQRTRARPHSSNP